MSKYPTDFLAMTHPFDEDELESLLHMHMEDIAWTIDTLKKREVNASNSYTSLKLKIMMLIETKTEQRKKLIESNDTAISNILEDQINLLESLLS